MNAKSEKLPVIIRVYYAGNQVKQERQYTKTPLKNQMHDSDDEIPDLIDVRDAPQEERTYRGMSFDDYWASEERLKHCKRMRHERWLVLLDSLLLHDNHASTTFKQPNRVHTKGQPRQRTHNQKRQLYGTPVRRK